MSKGVGCDSLQHKKRKQETVVWEDERTVT